MVKNVKHKNRLHYGKILFTESGMEIHPQGEKNNLKISTTKELVHLFLQMNERRQIAMVFKLHWICLKE